MVAGKAARTAVAGRIDGPAGSWSPGGGVFSAAGKPRAIGGREEPQPIPMPRPEPAPPDPDPRPPMPRPPAWFVLAAPEHGASRRSSPVPDSGPMTLRAVLTRCDGYARGRVPISAAPG